MKLRVLFAIVACCLASGRASAQSGFPSGDRGLTDEQKVERTADHLARMKTALKQVLARVEEARNEKDVVKLNCVNEKLTQVKGLLRVAEQADVALRQAVTKQDGGSDAEYSKIAMARLRAETLRAEAEQCIGQLAYVVDERTTVEVQQPADLPADLAERSAQAVPTASAPRVIRPSAASPF